MNDAFGIAITCFSSFLLGCLIGSKIRRKNHVYLWQDNSWNIHVEADEPDLVELIIIEEWDKYSDDTGTVITTWKPCPIGIDGIYAREEAKKCKDK